MILTASILGTLVGGVTSAIPGVLNLFMKREELRNERELLKIRSDLAKTQAEHQINVINTQADAFEGESLRRHDSGIDGTGFIGALRASVRPVITYLFFALFVFVKLIAVWTFIQNGASADWLGNALAWQELYPIIWDDNTQGIFGAIMGFWFGSRTIEKLRGYQSR